MCHSRRFFTESILVRSAFKPTAQRRQLLESAACTAFLCLMVLLAAERQTRCEDGSERDDAKKQRAAMLERMRKRAASAKVYQLVDGKRIEATLVRDPLMRYDDQPNRFYDATLWIWTSNGRPVAVCKIEDHRPVKGGALWMNCLGSLSSGLLRVEWQDGRRWSSKKRGLELRQIPKAPEPAETKVRRLLQMKNIARRFSAATRRASANNESRLLPHPIYRYAQPTSGIQDAAIFALTSNGTNPNGLFIIELRKTESSGLVWHYGAVGMTGGELWVRLDGKEVWRKERGSGFDRLIYFFSPQTDRSDR